MLLKGPHGLVIYYGAQRYTNTRQNLKSADYITDRNNNILLKKADIHSCPEVVPLRCHNFSTAVAQLCHPHCTRVSIPLELDMHI